MNRLRERRSWVVSFWILGPFGPSHRREHTGLLRRLRQGLSFALSRSAFRSGAAGQVLLRPLRRVPILRETYVFGSFQTNLLYEEGRVFRLHEAPGAIGAVLPADAVAWQLWC